MTTPLRVGLTYDLRSEYLAAGYSLLETAEFDRDDTIESLETALRRLGHCPVRIGHARQLAAALVAGERWDLVFNIAEGLRGPGREAQVPALLELYGIPHTFGDPLVMALSLDKALTKRVVRDAGLPTAPFCVARQTADLEAVDFPGPWFAKPVAEGTGKGIHSASVLHDRADLAAAVRALLAEFRQGVLIEGYLPGREFTVGLLGGGPGAEVIGSLEIELLAGDDAQAYGYLNKEESEARVAYRLVSAADPTVAAAEAVALAAWRLLGGQDAGRVDLRCDAAGHPCFIEVNPLAGLHPEHSDLPMLWTALGRPYHELIGAIVDAARQRAEVARACPDSA